MMGGGARRLWRSARRALDDLRTLAYLHQRSVHRSDMAVGSVDYDRLRRSVLGFVDSMRVGPDGFRYRYSKSCTLPTLYASTYACMIRAMVQALPAPSVSERWVRYFDSFQHEDGLFYDPAVDCAGYADTDWWGARHLAVHVVQAYAALGARPARPFRFLETYEADGGAVPSLVAWIDEAGGRGDGDNRIMNVGCLLQYQRDTWGDGRAGRTLERLKGELRSRIDPNTGFWRGLDLGDPAMASRAVQIAYHFLPLFLYDDDRSFAGDRLVAAILRLQNRVGGFAQRLSSSACEDIDAIDVMLAFAQASEGHEQVRAAIRAAAGRALRWILANHMDDGGFVFRLHEPFVFGHPELASGANQGALFPTWFRLLSIGSLMRFLDGGDALDLPRCAGYSALSYRPHPKR